jgi:hypothetical protein
MLPIRQGSFTGTSSRRNLFITDRGQAKILDFGLAKTTRLDDEQGLTLSHDVGQLTGHGATLGTVSAGDGWGESQDANRFAHRAHRLLNWSHETFFFRMPVANPAAEHEQISLSTGNNFGQRFSPDGLQMVFQSSRGGPSVLWLHEMATGAERQLT